MRDRRVGPGAGDHDAAVGVAAEQGGPVDAIERGADRGNVVRQRRQMVRGGRAAREVDHGGGQPAMGQGLDHPRPPPCLVANARTPVDEDDAGHAASVGWAAEIRNWEVALCCRVLTQLSPSPLRPPQPRPHAPAMSSPAGDARRDRIRRIRLRVAAGAATGFVALWGAVWAFGQPGSGTAKAAASSTGTGGQDPGLQGSGTQDPGFQDPGSVDPSQSVDPSRRRGPVAGLPGAQDGSSAPAPMITGQS